MTSENIMRAHGVPQVWRRVLLVPGLDRRPERGPQSAVEQARDGGCRQRQQTGDQDRARSYQRSITFPVELEHSGVSTVAPVFILVRPTQKVSTIQTLFSPVSTVSAA